MKEQMGCLKRDVPARCWGELFGYDPWGNLLSISGVSTDYNGCTQENLSVAVNPQNQIIGNTYDAAGNLFIAQPGNVQYNYDAENHLISTAGQTYLYDGDGKRVEKATNGTPLVPNKLYWYGAEDSPVLETDATGNELYRYFRFLGTLVAREEANDWVDHYGVDALGNVRFLYGLNGAWDHSDYYPFGGERVVLSQNNNNTRKFTGKERDPESGLDNFGARYLSSQYGRFMSPDPGGNAVADASFPQSWNLYSYVMDNPLNLIDPNGLDCAYLDDSGSGAESIDHNSNIGECQQNGGYWAYGAINQLSWVQTNPFNDNALIYSQFSNGGIGVSLASQTTTQGAFALSDDAAESMSCFQEWAPMTGDQQRLLTLKLAGLEAEHDLGCLGVPGVGVTSGGAAFKLGQPVPGSKPFVSRGTSIGTSPASSALRDALPQKLPVRVPTPVGGPGTGTPLRMAATDKLGAAVGRYVPFAGAAVAAYSAYKINQCLDQKP